MASVLWANAVFKKKVDFHFSTTNGLNLRFNLEPFILRWKNILYPNMNNMNVNNSE